MTKTPKVVTRFAPSPTGYLHVGGARTALFNWLLARHAGGDFLLRIEDTDTARSTAAAVDALVEDLKWLGLFWDNPKLVFQSQRKAVYDSLIDRLIADGKAYKAYETPAELDAMRKAAEAKKQSFAYRRRDLTSAEIAAFEKEGRPAVVRFAMPVQEYRFHDIVIDKDVAMPAAEAQDFVIRKADGMPTYHFGVVVDDAEMGITHVLRGQEHTKNTFLHVALQEALGYPRPIYAHLSTILNLDGSKMGKRDRDKKTKAAVFNWMKNTKKTAGDLATAIGWPVERIDAWLKSDAAQIAPADHAMIAPVVGLKKSDLPEILVHDFRENGYLPDALLNFLALLGWNPGGDKEAMTRAELISLFSFEGIGKSNSKFDRTKLLSFNTTAGAAGDPAAMVGPMRAYLAVNPDSPLNRADDKQLAELIRMKAGFRTLREIDEASRSLLLADHEVVYQPDAVEKVLARNAGEGKNILRELSDVLEVVVDWSHDPLAAAVKTYAEGKSLTLGKAAQPLRVALTGGVVSPSVFDAMVFLGRESSMKRIERALS